MKLSDQVCSLELSKRLHELGVKQESLFYWQYFSDDIYGVQYNPYAVVPDEFNKCILYSAFTAAELGGMLPALIIYKGMNLFICMDCEKQVFYEEFDPDEKQSNIFGLYPSNIEDEDNEANARAKMLIYLLENGLIKL